MIQLNENKLPTEEVGPRCRRFYDFHRGVPVLSAEGRNLMRCPVCRGDDYIYRWHQFFNKRDSATRRRCDISFKCQICSFVWTCGVVVPEEEWQVWDWDHRSKVGIVTATRMTWKEINTILAGGDPPDFDKKDQKRWPPTKEEIGKKGNPDDLDGIVVRAIISESDLGFDMSKFVSKAIEKGQYVDWE